MLAAKSARECAHMGLIDDQARTSTSDAEKEDLHKTSGCFKCRLKPSSPSWYPHNASTCRNGVPRNSSPSRNIKSESTAAAALTEEDGFFDGDIPSNVIASVYLEDTDPSDDDF